MSEKTNLNHYTAADWLSDADFPHSAAVAATLKTVFGLQRLREQQTAVVNAALCDQNVFVLMPTGGGKSLCYQLPAVVKPGTTLVVSPLLSLISDQVAALRRLGVTVVSMTSAGADGGVRPDGPENGEYAKLIYATPERAVTAPFLQLLDEVHRRGLLQRIVIDEAHCISQWGADFRPQYGGLSVLGARYAGVPLMALTATASAAVQQDIVAQLGLERSGGFVAFRASLNRPNLRYAVCEKPFGALGRVIHARIVGQGFAAATGIVYCFSKADCEALAKELNEVSGSPTYAAAYHAGVVERAEVQRRWMIGQIKVVCATIACGMGIDKPDVRFVYHQTLPKTMEGYYQESGRAGRDGLQSDCAIFYHPADDRRVLSLITNQGNNNDNRMAQGYAPVTDDRIAQIRVDFAAVTAYCRDNRKCRRALQLVHFGETFDRALCGATCDNCIAVAQEAAAGKRQRTIDELWRKRPKN